jgi:hypothetical protein
MLATPTEELQPATLLYDPTFVAAWSGLAEDIVAT